MIVIEHSPEVMVSADWIIDLGPGGGDEGGRLVAEGTPEDVAKSQTPTGEVLAKVACPIKPHMITKLMQNGQAPCLWGWPQHCER